MIQAFVNFVKRVREQLAAKRDERKSQRHFDPELARRRAASALGQRKARRLTTKQLTSFGGKPVYPATFSKSPKQAKGHKGKRWRRDGPVYRSRKLRKRLQGGW